MAAPAPVTVLILLAVLANLAPTASPADTKLSEREAMYHRYLEFPSLVKGGSVTPHWMADGSSFWYAEGAPDKTVIYKVDPKANTKLPLFDTARLRRALTPVLGQEPPHQGLPFAEFTFLKGEKAVQFAVADREFILQLGGYAVTRAPVLSEEERRRQVPQRLPTYPGHFYNVREERSPDGRWFLGFRDHNLWLRSAPDGRQVPLTTDGVEDYEWNVTYPQASPRRGIEWSWWSPDSSRVAVKKLDYRNARKKLIVHDLKQKPEVEWVRPHWTNDAGSRAELYFVEIASGRQVRIDTGNDPGQNYFMFVGWRSDGSEFLFLRLHPTFKQLDLLVANPVSGATRIILTERQKTFIHGRGFGWQNMHCTLLKDGKRFLWRSERDGWNHLYLYGVDGRLVRRLTAGEFPIEEVVAVDEPGGWIYFTAHDDRQRPYDTHLCRVSLEGKRFTRLTEAIGQHRVQLAPSNAFFMDTHSTIDRPPAVELRRADGKLLQTLSKANVDALKELKWSPPDEFVVKAADGKTNLYGVLFKPFDFDPHKKYPVIDCIFGAPDRTMVPRTFSADRYESAEALAQLGYITFMVDGRGSPGRGKAFQDVVYGNIGRHEIPDNVATLKQLGERLPFMDLSRVGVIGYSWGGYTALRAMLLAPDAFRVGIATEFFARAPMDDDYSYGSYMGNREENREGYEYASNLHLAGNLKGKLLLIYATNEGTQDAMKMVDALIQAGKFFDLLPMPEQRHGIAGTSAKYREALIRRYFQEHLKP